MHTRLKAFIVVLLLMGVGGYAIAQSQSPVALQSTDQVQIYGRNTGLTVYSSGAQIAGFGRSTQLLFSTAASVQTTASTAEQILGSTTIAGGTLSASEGNKLKLYVAFSATPNTDTKNFTCYYGQASVTVSTKLNGGSGRCEWTVTKIGSGQLFYGEIRLPSAVTPITTHTVYATETDSGNVTAKFTGTSPSNATAGEITMDDFWIERVGN